MEKLIEIKIKLYGYFRDCASTLQKEMIPLSFNKTAHLLNIKEKLKIYLDKHCTNHSHDLILQSAFASEAAYIDEDTQIDQSVTLAIIPPVNGG